MLTAQQLFVALWAIHIVFWFQIGRRAVIARKRLREERQAAAGPEAAAAAVSFPARLAMWLTSSTMIVYYVLLVLWFMNESYAGSAVLRPAPVWQWIGLAAAAAGTALMGWAFHVFRSFRFVAALEGEHELCTKGPYRFVRHPLYAGINLVYWGSFLAVPHVAFLLQAAANSLTYDFRARVEERVLVDSFGDRYRAYARGAARFIPGLY